MDSRLLDYYNRELAWLREMGTEFAGQYPQVAGRLGMESSEHIDPYVERLMEGVAFLTARIHLKMDAEFPRFSRHLLDMLYPNYLAATPSMAIVELRPDITKGDIGQGYRVPRGTVMDSGQLKSRGVTCRFRTAHEVELQPLRIEHVELGGVPADIMPSALGLRGTQSALRIKLACLGHVTLGEMRCQRLMFHLSADDISAGSLLELMMRHTQTVLVQTGDGPARRLNLGREALRHEGLDPGQAMMPEDARQLDAFRLLQEYFSFPARLQFFSIQGLQTLLDGGGKHQRLEIILLLDKSAPDLERRVDRRHLALHCTPVINLFPRAAERIMLTERRHEYPLMVDTLHPYEYEVHSIVRLHGCGPQGENGYQQRFRPFYDRQNEDGPEGPGGYSLRREQRPWPINQDPATPYTGYSGSLAYVSLADERHPPWHGALTYLSAEVLCTNGDLPMRLTPQERQFVMRDSLPVERVVLRHGPSAPRPALAESESCWPLINQLQLNYAGLMACDGADSGAALRQLLRFHARQADITVRQQIAGIRQCLPTPCHRVMAPPALARRGVGISLSVDEQAFSGLSPWLLGSVLARLFTRLATVNSFTETTLTSIQRGAIGYWPPCQGSNSLL